MIKDKDTDNYKEQIFRSCYCCKHCHGDENDIGVTCSVGTSPEGVSFNGTCDKWEAYEGLKKDSK